MIFLDNGTKPGRKIWLEDLSNTNIKFESSRDASKLYTVPYRYQVFERIKGDVSLVRIAES